MKVLKYKTADGKYEDLYSTYKEPDPFNGYEYVDMGEAGIWAKYPIGVTKWETVENDIKYFAWGETEGWTKEQIEKGEHTFNWNNYKFGPQSNITKYNETDNLITLELEDDAAHIVMGGNWRIPTKDEVEKLHNLCDTEYIENYKETGMSARIFKLKTDETKQLLFLYWGEIGPSGFNNFPKHADIWTSSVYTPYPSKIYAYDLSIGTNGVNSSDGRSFRYVGSPIMAFIPKS